MEQRISVVVREFVAPVQEVQFENKTETRDPPTQLFDKPRGCGCRTAGRQHVVDDQNPLSVLNRVLMDLQAVRSVFEIVFPKLNFTRKLLRLTDRHEATAQRKR